MPTEFLLHKIIITNYDLQTAAIFDIIKNGHINIIEGVDLGLDLFHDIFNSNGFQYHYWITDQWFTVNIEYIQERLNIKKTTATKCISNLKKAGLIKIKKSRSTDMTFYKIPSLKGVYGV